jgi:predicted MFS family arabinose efflux permease
MARPQEMSRMARNGAWFASTSRSRSKTVVVHRPWPHEVPEAAATPATRNYHLEFAAFILSLCYACALFQRLAFQGVGSALASEFSLDAAQLADLGASFFWTYLALMIPCGILVDAQGPRRMAIFGALLSGAGCAMFAAARGLPELMAARVVISAGGAFAFVCMMRFIGSTFPKRKATLSGRGIFIANLGAIAAGAPLAIVLSQLHWREVWASLAVGWLVLAIAVRDRMPPDQVEKLGSMQPRAIAFELRTIFGSTHTYLGIVIIAGLAGTYWAFANLVAPGLLSLSKLSAIEAGTQVSVLVCGYAIGAACWGWLGDRWRREWLLALACGLSCAMWLALTWADALSLPIIGGLFFVAGFGSGAFGLIYLVLTERYPPTQGGLVIASVNCGIPLGAALAQMVAGRLHGTGMMVPILAGCCAALFGAIVLSAARGAVFRRVRRPAG